MRATVELPESVYRRTEQVARTRGLSVDELISGVLERELGKEPSYPLAQKRVAFPELSILLLSTSMIYLPDVNVWIALASDQHIHTASATAWLQSVRNEQVAFCRITELGLLRLLTNVHVMGDEVRDHLGGLGRLRRNSDGFTDRLPF
jgi:hypothetical protein